MKVKNHTNFAFTNYEQKGKERLGEIVKKYDEDNRKWEIGVIIQNHGEGEYRVDTWGNCHYSEIKTATKAEVEKLRPELLAHLTQDIPLFAWSKSTVKNGLERYPEFTKLVQQIANETCKKINWEAHKIESEMPYKAQFVLEEVIQELQKRV
jgi:hypothetical protein